MNKTTLGTIVGAALLGLAKSKIGGKNNPNPSIVILKHAGYTQSNQGTQIVIKSIPEDIKEIAQVFNTERQLFQIPTTAVIEFQLESTSIEFPEYPIDQIQEYEDDCKRWHFDENEQLDDDDEDKQDWEDWEDVPSYYVEDLVEERRESVQQDYGEQCYNVVGDFMHPIAGIILNDIEHSEEYFQRCKRFIGKRNVYLTIEEENSEWEEDGWIRMTYKLLLNSDNPLFVINFVADLDDYLSDTSDYDESEDVSLQNGPTIIEINFPNEGDGPRLRKR